MNARKRADRAKNRFDGKENTGYVKPMRYNDARYIPELDALHKPEPEVDADGNIIPDYE